MTINKSVPVFLADWQDGVGDKDIGLNIDSLELSTSKEETIQQAKKVMTDMEGYEEWMKVVKEDETRLRNQLEHLEKNISSQKRK